ncbi:NAD(P)-dependent oxidoreductase [Vagococcus salmoninarum]|uniref:NADH-flavin reductase n=1 Tax=Vagococcus salmoninarum TaxID=2739 RepID=A0A429ZV17_9ENTE|nr:NAD(P)H-binding protein [Vagococcus salmoninarum]MBE9389276.1 NAD(P)H-binding protein [Vagococcus salmoninarum]RST97539.1 NADH-flavin reductase [Vagococcus salmoninarum]
MKIGIIGATGKQGNLVLLEAYRRGHEVTALIRDQSKLVHEVPFIEKELYDLTPAELEEFDVIVNAFNALDIMPQLHQTSLRHITKVLKDLDTRLYVVGGAGSLYIDDSKTTQLFETDDFPAAFLPTATNMAKALEELRNSKGTNWTYVSPAANFDFEGDKTGQYQIAGEVLTLNAQGESSISYLDYASGLIEIIESGKFNKERVSLVSK